MSVSVLICCHNGERYLRQTLGSVLGQTLQPREVIVVDDGSTDGSAGVAESFGGPVRVIRQSNQGLPASRNVAIEAASGEYLFFIDADDLIEPMALEYLLEAARSQRDAVAIMGYQAFIDDVQRPIATHECQLDGFFPAIIGGNFGPQHNRLVPRSLALRAGCFDPEMYIFEDWLFWCRVALCGAKLIPVRFVGAHYRRHSATMSYTAKPAAYARGQIRVMEELSAGFLTQRHLLERYGDVLFWACWGTLERARRQGFAWNEVRRLAENLGLMVKRGPKLLRQSKSAWLVRLLGTRWAQRVHGALASRKASIEVDQDPMRLTVLAHADVDG